MNIEIVPMFPTPILINNIGRDFTNDEMDCILNYKDDVRQHTGNITTNDVFVLENEKLNDIKDLVCEALNDYLKQVYEPINDLKLVPTISWLNYTDKTQYHHKHNHSNSFISGCLYINANRESDCIIFSKRPTGDNFILQCKEFTAFNSDDFRIPVHTGDLVLFPSNLIHSVPKTNHEHTRISLAFNSFFSGELGFINGDMRGINYLKVKYE